MLRLPTENILDREGKIMAEWLKTSLIDIVELIGGGTPKTSKTEYWGGNINWLSVKDFNNENRYVYYTEKTITEEGLNNSSTKLLKKDDIIISARGTVGELAMIPFPMAFNQSCYGIRAKEGIDSTFLYYLIKNSVRKLKAMTHGSVFDTITRDTFANIEVSVPDIETQHRIAKMLADIDDKVENNQRINNNLLEQALTLYATYFAESEKNGCVGDYCIIKSGFAFKSSWWKDNGVKVIKIGSINQDNLNLLECSYVDEDKIDKAKDFKVEAGDLLIAMTGATIGKFTMVPYCSETLLVNQRVGKFFLGNNPVERLPFIYCTLKQPDVYYEIVNRGQGSAQPNISAADIMSIPCVIPTDNDLNTFNDTVRPLFDLIISNQQENQRLSELRDSLLPKLMSGELNVSEVDF